MRREESRGPLSARLATHETPGVVNPFRGGLLRYADSRGLQNVVARLKELEKKYGSRFAPNAPLRKLAESGTTFYQAYKR